MTSHTNDPDWSSLIVQDVPCEPEIMDGDFVHVIFKDKREIKGYASYPYNGVRHLLNVGGWATINLTLSDDISPVSFIQVLHRASIFERAFKHDNKGFSEEMCVRCGWVMGSQPLNCQNDDTPHVFPSQLYNRTIDEDLGYQVLATQRCTHRCPDNNCCNGDPE